MSRRLARIAHAVQEAVSTAILLDVKDPRVKGVTVLGAEVSEDVREAKILVSVMGDQKTEALSLRGLNAARGFLQSKVAARLQTRNTPILRFVVDHGVKRSLEVSALLRQALPPAPEAAPDDEAQTAAPPAGGEMAPNAPGESELTCGNDSRHAAEVQLETDRS